MTARIVQFQIPAPADPDDPMSVRDFVMDQFGRVRPGDDLIHVAVENALNELRGVSQVRYLDPTNLGFVAIPEGEELRAWAVDCPRCRARAGQYCRTKYGRSIWWTHMLRDRAWWAQQREEDR